MNLKLVALVACGAYGAWYVAIGGRQISEEHVRDLYHDYWSAFDKGDGKAVCSLFSDDVSGNFKSTSRSMHVKESIDKATACSAVDDFYQSKKHLEESIGQDLHTNFEYTIKSISISPDKKSATVEVLTEVRIGTEQKSLLDMRSDQVDKIKRSLGRAQFVQSDGTVSFYK